MLFRLAEWGQDDGVAPNPLPLRLLVENITLHLEDDSSSPSAKNPPLDVSMPGRIRVSRDRLGMVVVSAGGTGDKEEEELLGKRRGERNPSEVPRFITKVRKI